MSTNELVKPISWLIIELFFVLVTNYSMYYMSMYS